MIEFSLHPNIYATGVHNGLRSMLEDAWVRLHEPGDGTLYIISGFANYNGGARFYRPFREHTENGGKIIAFLGGSPAQRLSSKQVVEALLECGAEVNIVNRKRLLHAKLYGGVTSTGQTLVLSSGNFTGPGMSQNVEASLILKDDLLTQADFLWDDLIAKMYAQTWLRYNPGLDDFDAPGWKLLYDETPGLVVLDESEEITLIVILGHADTARIQAERGTKAALGSQYLWLSKDSFDFFPPLTIRNKRGYKGTLSAQVNLHYVDLDLTDNQCRVTFEAENNLDFRLGTGKLRYTKLAKQGDLACLSRVGEDAYELRIIKQDMPVYRELSPHAINFIGHQGKRYGYIDNPQFEEIMGMRLKTYTRKLTTRT
ncbi:MAG: restriction endonuclease [Anaerolineaceae bacterium 4572_5.2]|nr:MAG: restriction endonuclease [Anaerolineaceae bacterium 4572_5.2]